ncbi:hypothetical protein DITRI_Ditri10aG0115200 [Diplodiscus trichospermus]
MSTVGEMEQLTSGASNRIIPILRTLRTPLIFIQSMILYLLLLLFPRRRHYQTAVSAVDPAAESPQSLAKSARRRSVWRREEEDTLKRRALAEGLDMGFETGDGEIACRWSTSLFFGVRRNALFCRSWFPGTCEMKGILIIIHGLNEHSGRYAQFARQLTARGFGVYAMDWIGHGGSDGLHGYVPSLDHVVADTGAFLEKIKSENPGVPCFLFGHSTGGAVVLKAASHPRIREMLEGIVLTSPALRVKPAHPIVSVSCCFLFLVSNVLNHAVVASEIYFLN